MEQSIIEENQFEPTASESIRIHIPSNAFDVKDSADDEPLSNSTIMFNYTYPETQSMQKWDFNEMYIRSNSPIASNYNSDVENDTDALPDPFSFENGNTNYSCPDRKTKRYKKFTSEDIELYLSKYDDKSDVSFNEIDLMMTYLKAYTIIYSQSKNVTQMKLYSFLMMTLSVTMFLSIIAPFVKDTEWGAYLISAGNALATIFIAFSRYLKLESNSLQYNTMAIQYGKLETALCFNSENTNKAIGDCIAEVENKIADIKEIACHCLVPDEIAQLFPLISNTNIFRFIHKMTQYKKNLIVRLRDIKNEIHYIMHRWNINDGKIDDAFASEKTPQRAREKTRLLYLMDLKEKTKSNILQCNDVYNQIDELFHREIRYAETHQSCFGCGGWFKPDYDFSKLNPVVREYLKLVIPD